jgi:hypothetical protein
MYQPSEPLATVGTRQVTYTEKLLDGTLTTGSQLSYSFKVATQPEVLGAALWVTLMDQSTSLYPSNQAADQSGDHMFYRICVNKRDGWGVDCDEMTDVPPNQWAKHVWNVHDKFVSKYPSLTPPSRIKLQFATYGGATMRRWDYDNFEDAKDTWKNRNGYTPERVCGDGQAFEGDCYQKHRYAKGRNFEGSTREEGMSAYGYDVRNFKDVCMAYNIASSESVSILVNILSHCPYKDGSGSLRHKTVSGWRTLDMNSCRGAATADKAAYCEWTYPYMGSFEVAVTDAWNRECVDMQLMLDKFVCGTDSSSSGQQGFHRIDGFMFHSSVKKIGGVATSSSIVDGADFLIDDFEISSPAILDAADVYVDDVRLETIADASMRKVCSLLEVSAAYDGLVPGATWLDMRTGFGATQEGADAASAALALDNSTGFDSAACSASSASAAPYWRLDLGKSYCVETVSLDGPHSSDASLGRAQVSVGDAASLSNPLCGTVALEAATSTFVSCEGRCGRYLTVHAVLPAGTTKPISLCEVRVKAAANTGGATQVVRQSSMTIAEGTPAVSTTASYQFKVLDPETLSLKESKSFTVAELDKLAPYIDGIAEGDVVMSTANEHHLAGAMLFSEDFGGHSLPRAQYSMKPIALFEVGYKDMSTDAKENLAYGKPARLSSAVHYWGKAEVLTDGQTNCRWGWYGVTHTGSEAKPWNRVDIGFGTKVDPTVTTGHIHVRSDWWSADYATYGFNVYVGSDKYVPTNNALCNTGGALKHADDAAMQADNRLAFTCTTPLQGKYFFVVAQWTGYLRGLCEIQLWRTKPAAELANFEMTAQYKVQRDDYRGFPISTLGSQQPTYLSASATSALSSVEGPPGRGRAINFGAADAIQVYAPTYHNPAFDHKCGVIWAPGARSGMWAGQNDGLDPQWACCNYERGSYGYVGNDPNHCECSKCKDYRAYPFDELKPSHDTYVDQANPTVNHGADTQFNMGYASSQRRVSLLKFDTSGIAAGKKVKRVDLKLYAQDGGRVGHWRIHPNTQDFDEASATWASHDSKWDTNVLLENWQTRVSTGWRSTSRHQSFKWNYGSAMLDQLVQQWIDDPSSNFGIAIYPIGSGADTKWASKELYDPNIHTIDWTPRLEIQYEYDSTAPNSMDHGTTFVPGKELRNCCPGILGKNPVGEVATQERCADYCSKELRCTGFTYDIDTQECSLKSGTPAFEDAVPSTKNVVSGIRPKRTFQPSVQGYTTNSLYVIDADFKLPLVRTGQERYILVTSKDGLEAHVAFER